jgi:UDP-GlcNAc:undecaprenyl-phosphate GlcNAc-1-phosphate transferase
MPAHAIIISTAVAAALGVVTLPVFIRLAHRFGLLDRPGRHKRHKSPVPYLGGLALFISLWGSAAVLWLAFPELTTDVDRLLPFIIAGAVAITAVGFVDDLRSMPAWLKLSVEVLVGMILYAGGLIRFRVRFAARFRWVNSRC